MTAWKSTLWASLPAVGEREAQHVAHAGADDRPGRAGGDRCVAMEPVAPGRVLEPVRVDRLDALDDVEVDLDDGLLGAAGGRRHVRRVGDVDLAGRGGGRSALGVSSGRTLSALLGAWDAVGAPEAEATLVEAGEAGEAAAEAADVATGARPPSGLKVHRELSAQPMSAKATRTIASVLGSLFIGGFFPQMGRRSL